MSPRRRSLERCKLTALHPIRIRILEVLKANGPLRYKELMDLVVAKKRRKKLNFAYHLRVLRSLGMIEKDHSQKTYKISNRGEIYLAIIKMLEFKDSPGRLLLINDTNGLEFNPTSIRDAIVDLFGLDTNTSNEIIANVLNKLIRVCKSLRLKLVPVDLLIIITLNEILDKYSPNLLGKFLNRTVILPYDYTDNLHEVEEGSIEVRTFMYLNNLNILRSKIIPRKLKRFHYLNIIRFNFPYYFGIFSESISIDTSLLQERSIHKIISLVHKLSSKVGGSILLRNLNLHGSTAHDIEDVLKTLHILWESPLLNTKKYFHLSVSMEVDEQTITAISKYISPKSGPQVLVLKFNDIIKEELYRFTRIPVALNISPVGYVSGFLDTIPKDQNMHFRVLGSLTFNIKPDTLDEIILLVERGSISKVVRSVHKNIKVPMKDLKTIDIFILRFTGLFELENPYRIVEEITSAICDRVKEDIMIVPSLIIPDLDFFINNNAGKYTTISTFTPIAANMDLKTRINLEEEFYLKMKTACLLDMVQYSHTNIKNNLHLIEKLQIPTISITRDLTECNYCGYTTPEIVLECRNCQSRGNMLKTLVRVLARYENLCNLPNSLRRLLLRIRKYHTKELILD
ncbi:MAG: hypothetical protein DRN53_01975 [Thermoprotei archaeon]|nr:MAG: hypothetical protein DRN53_01975 [Thermoprotei archaeon]